MKPSQCTGIILLSYIDYNRVVVCVLYVFLQHTPAVTLTLHTDHLEV